MRSDSPDLRRIGQSRSDNYVQTHDKSVISPGGRRRSCGKCGRHIEAGPGWTLHKVRGYVCPACSKPKGGAG